MPKKWNSIGIAGVRVAALLLLAGLQGCVVATKEAVIVPQIQTMFEGTYVVDPAMEAHRPTTVAVLPFVDKSQHQEASDVVRKGFYNHFSSLPFKDMELFRVDSLLAKAGLTDPAAISETKPQDLGKLLGVDAVVYGSISDFDKLFAVVYSNVSVGAEVRMYDAKTGQFLWSGRHVARIHEGGVATTPVGIIATIIATAVNVRDYQLLRACDDLFRDMVKTIPAPTLTEAARPPVITLLTQDTRNVPKKAGDEIKVVIQGTPKMTAYFDIGQYRRRIDMQELEAGGYLGVYKVLPGDNVTKAVITGYLADDTGNTAQWVDAVGTVSMDTDPPGSPARVSSVGRNASVILSWEKPGADDLAEYRIYRSITPLSGYQEAARTQFTELRDEKLVNGKNYYYQITAVDRAGNESAPSASILGMPVAPGPTPVSGTIETDTTWYAGASPYIMEETVTIQDKAVLTIEPGTEIRVKTGSLVVEGSLVARGEEGRLIVFDTAKEGRQWGGILFNNVREEGNVLAHCRIRAAWTAVTCVSSSPRVEANEFIHNETAVRISGAHAKPRLAGNAIRSNTGAGIVIENGSGPLVIENAIAENAREGILIMSAAPIIQHNAVTRNAASGIAVLGGQASIRENNITDNKPFDMTGEETGEAVDALANWWGVTGTLEVLARIRGRIDVLKVLNAPWPRGQHEELPILPPVLDSPVTKDAFLVLSRSPYRVTKNIVIDGGGTLTIEPGVEIRFDQNTAFVVEDGGIVARGTAERPIRFVPSAASPLPGAYASAVRLSASTRVNSVFVHCVVAHATLAFDIYRGSPEIAFCLITGSAQAGIYCRNDAAPKISYSTFRGNLGEGAITAVGLANPTINHNNFFDNVTALRAFSSICIDARYNWWGQNPPDMNTIWGEAGKNLIIDPPLKKAETRAFDPPLH